MATDDVTSLDAGPRKVARSVVVGAPAHELFTMVADPHRHPEIDGSGTVRDSPVKGPHVLSDGDRFSVAMKQYGVPYTITSTATEVREDRVVEWRHPLGHRWRWEFEALSPTSTRVTETFDYTGALSPKMLEVFKMDAANSAGITKTLRALAARYDGPTG